MLNCTVSKADDTKARYVQAIINEHHGRYNEIVSAFEEIWIGYTSANINIVIPWGTERFVIERANYYYKRDGNLVFLGHVDMTGVHDRDGNLLRAIPDTRPGDAGIVGISSSLIEQWSFTVHLIFRVIRPDGSEGYFESEVWEFLDIDIGNASLSLRDRSGFWGQ